MWLLLNNAELKPGDKVLIDSEKVVGFTGGMGGTRVYMDHYDLDGGGYFVSVDETPEQIAGMIAAASNGKPVVSLSLASPEKNTPPT